MKIKITETTTQKIERTIEIIPAKKKSPAKPKQAPSKSSKTNITIAQI